MLSHPVTFLVGYLVVTFIVSFVVLGPAAVYGVLLFRRRHESRYFQGVYLGASVMAFGFMILHYLLYLRGYAIGSWSRLFGDLFYPPRYF